MKKKLISGMIILMLVAAVYTLTFCQKPQGDPKLTEVWEPVPVVVTPGEGKQPPSDAIVLFDGKNFSQWQHTDGSEPKWLLEDGCMTVVKKTGEIRTKQAFGDCQLHIEWRAPEEVVGEGQGRGNSGVFLQGRYEIQVLDSYNNRTYSNGQAGSVYKQHIPLVNVCRPPGEWQEYDILFRAPRFDDEGNVNEPARVTVLHNNVLIQNNVEIQGTIAFIGKPKYEKHNPKEPLSLQDHGNPVSFRNIWIREI